MDRSVFNKEWWFDQPWRWSGLEKEDELRIRIPSTNWTIYNKKVVYFPFYVLYKKDSLRLEVEAY